MRTEPPNPKRIAYGGTGGNPELDVPFEFQDDTDILVTSVVDATGIPTVLVLGTHYNVGGGSGATGTVTPIDGATDFPLTVRWVITGDEPSSQTLNLVQGDDTPHDALEIRLDRLTDQVTQLTEEVGRSIKIPIGDVSGTSTEVDNEVARANKYLVYDASGNPSTLATGASGGTDLIIASGDRYVSTTARTAAQRWSEIVRVEDYDGIAPDGSDQYAKIQLLFDNICALAQNPNGVEVIFGNGDYRTDTELNVWAGGIRIRGQGVGITTNQGVSDNPANVLNLASTSLYAGVAMSSGVVKFAPKDTGGKLAEDQLLTDCGLSNMLVSGSNLVTADDIALADYGVVVENCVRWTGRNFNVASSIVAGVWVHEVTPVGGGSTQRVEIDGYNYDYGRKAAAYASDGIRMGDPTVAFAGVVLSILNNISGLVYNGDLVGMRGGAIQNRIGDVLWQSGGGGTGKSVAFYNDGAAGVAAGNYLKYTNGPIFAESGTFNTAGEMQFIDGSIHIETGAVLKRGSIVEPTEGAVFTDFGQPMKDSFFVNSIVMHVGAYVSTTGAAEVEFGGGTATTIRALAFSASADTEATFHFEPPRGWGYGFIRSMTFVYGYGAASGGFGGNDTTILETGINVAQFNSVDITPPSSGAGYQSTTLTDADYIGGSYYLQTITLDDANGNSGGIYCAKAFNTATLNPDGLPGTIAGYVRRLGTDGADNQAQTWTLLGIMVNFESIGPGYNTKETITFDNANNQLTHAGTDVNYKTDDFGPVRFYTSTDDLPTELTSDTDYWLTYVSDTICELQDGPGGTPVTFTDNGTGTRYMYKVTSIGDDAT